MSQVKIDWAKPLITARGAKAVYNGVQLLRAGKKIEDGYKHLVVLADGTKSYYSNEYGQYDRNGVPHFWIKNPEEPKPKAVKPAKEALVSAIDPELTQEVVHLTEEMGTLKDQVLGLRKQIVQGVEVLVKIKDEIHKATVDAQKLAASQQQHFLDAIILFVEEMKALKASATPHHPAPAPVTLVDEGSKLPKEAPAYTPPVETPAPVKPKIKMDVVKPAASSVQAFRNRLGVSKEKLEDSPLDKIDDPEAYCKVMELLANENVLKINVGTTNWSLRPGGSKLTGMMDIRETIKGGFKCRVLTKKGAQDLFVYTTPGYETEVQSFVKENFSRDSLLTGAGKS